MSMDNQPRVGSLEQFQIALYASKDKRLSACDLAVFFEIVDRFLKDKGITRPTGKTHLERETGRSNGSIKESLRRLVEWEYISVAKRGSGTRGSEYLPNFEWATRIATAVKFEVKERATAKVKRRSRAGFRPTSETHLDGQNSAPLRNLVGQPTAPLTSLVGRDSALETYVSPTGGDYVGNKTDPAPGALALRPAPGGAVLVDVQVSDAKLSSEDGEMQILVTMTGYSDETFEDVIVLESRDHKRQNAGQRQFASFRRSSQIDDVDNVEQLIGASLTIRSEDGVVEYIPPETWARRQMGITENDNTHATIAA